MPGDFSSPEALAEYIIRLDQDEELYLSYMDGPVFAPGRPDIKEYMRRLENFFFHGGFQWEHTA